MSDAREQRESDFQKRVAEARQALAEGRLVEYLSGSDAETVDRLGGVQDLAVQDASSKESHPESTPQFTEHDRRVFEEAKRAIKDGDVDALALLILRETKSPPACD